MTSLKYISIEEVADLVKSELKLYNEQGRIDTDDCVQYAVDELRNIGVPQIFDQKICIIPIVNNAGCLPDDIYLLDLVYKTNSGIQLNKRLYPLTTNVSTTTSTTTDDCSPVTTTVTKTVITRENCEDGQELLSIQNQISTSEVTEILNICEPMYYGGSDLKLLKDSTKNQYQKRYQSYIISGGSVITSFKEGYVIMTYLGWMLDQDGRPMIPDEYDVIQAVKQYIIFKIFEEDFRNKVEGSPSVYQEEMRKYQFLHDKAVNSCKLISIPEAYNKVYDTNRRYEKLRIRKRGPSGLMF